MAMFIRTKTSPKTNKTSVQIVQSFRNEQGQPRQRIIQHIGMASNQEELAQLRKLGEYTKAKMLHHNTPTLWSPQEEAERVLKAKQHTTETPPERTRANILALKEEQRMTTGIHEIYGQLYKEMGFDRLLAPTRQKAANRTLYHTVMARLAQPESKRASVQRLARHFGINLPLHKVYRMMDRLNDTFIDKLQRRVSTHSLDLLAGTFDVMYFDCTTLYFESVAEDTLRQFGFSKDGKSHEVQILLALMTTREGLPIGYQLFPGALWEGSSYLPMRQSLARRHPDIKAVHVADAGLMTDANLTAIEDEGDQYIMGARLRHLPGHLKDKILDTSRYRSVAGTEYSIGVFRHNGRRLVVSYSPARARKDEADRLRSTDKLLKKLKKSSNPRAMMGRGGRWKYISIQGKAKAVLDHDKVQEDARWDGLHGVITNLRNVRAADLLSRYRELWRIEESFRIIKTDLKVRPVYHWTEARIKAHLALSFMAFSLVRHLGHRLAGRRLTLSPEVIREALTHQQCSLIRDTETGRRYVMPSATTREAETIYKAMGVRMATRTHELVEED